MRSSLMLQVLCVASMAASSPAVVKTWDGGGGDAAWTNPLNWSPDGAPGPADDVVIDIPGDITVTCADGSAIAINSLVCNEKLVLSLGSLDVAAASSIGGEFQIATGPTTGLGGTGNLTVTGTLTWVSGRMQGSGHTIIAGRGTLNMNQSLTKILRRTVDNQGTCTWSGGLVSFAGGTFNNAGTFTVNPSGLAITATGTNVGANAFNNTGTFIKAGPDAVQFTNGTGTLPFNNAGTVDVQQNSLWLNNGGAHTGTFTSSGGATSTLIFGGSHTLSAAGEILGNGNVTFKAGSFASGVPVDLGGVMRFEAGTATFNDQVALGSTPVSLFGSTATFNAALVLPPGEVVIGGTFDCGPLDRTFARLTLNGTLDGSGIITVTDQLTFNGIMQGAGTTVAAPTASTFLNNVYLRRTFRNDGDASWPYGSAQFIGGTFVNNGTLTIGGPSIPINSVNIEGSTGINRFFNNGTFIKLGESQARFVVLNSPVAFQNDGYVEIQQGALEITAGTHSGDFELLPHAGPVASSLKINVGDTTLQPSGTIYAHAGNCAVGVDSGVSLFKSDGAIVLEQGNSLILERGFMAINGQFEIDAPFTVGPSSSTADLSLNSPAVFHRNSSLNVGNGGSVHFQALGSSIPSVSFVGAVLDGTADLHVTGNLNWTSGVMAGTGKTIIDSGAASTIGGNFGTTLSRTLQNDGSALLFGGTIHINNGQFVNNNVLTTDLNDVEFIFDNTAGTAALVNHGSFTKSGQHFFRLTGVPFENDGTFIVNTGKFEANAGISGTGTLNSIAPGELSLGSNAANNTLLHQGKLTIAPSKQLSLSGSLTAGAAAELNLIFLSPPPAPIVALGGAALDGTINTNVGVAFTPVLNQVIPLVNAASRTGRFQAGTFSNMPSPLTFRLMYDSTSAWLKVVRKGDVNGNNVTNIDDLLAVINAWGACPPEPAPCDADLNSDTVVGIDDLLMVINGWG